MENYKIVIPARRNSKGLPFKNRALFLNTLYTIPKKCHENVLVTTDDEWIITICINQNIKYVVRPTDLADDHASMKDVMRDLFKHFHDIDIDIDTNIIMLYLTYPERKWDDVEPCFKFFIEANAKSLLCKKEITSAHPYLYMFEKDDNKGEQLIKHNLYRRQDYPKVFELSHFICIFKASVLEDLNLNLYNKDTIFYAIDDKIDVDTEEDLKKISYENITYKNNPDS